MTWLLHLEPLTSRYDSAHPDDVRGHNYVNLHCYKCGVNREAGPDRVNGDTASTTSINGQQTALTLEIMLGVIIVTPNEERPGSFPESAC